MRPLDGPRLKLSHADEQIESLRAELREAMESDEHRLRLDLKNDFYDDSPAITLFVTDLPVFHPHTSITIGEIVHNLRSALDHLCWSLIPKSKMKLLKEEARRSVAFPFSRCAHGKWGYWQGKKRGSIGQAHYSLPGVSQPDRTFIERYQPYHRSTTGRAMRTLNVLSNTDKHRVIVPALFYPLGFNSNLKYEGAKQGERFVRLKPGREMKLGANLLTWTFSARPKNVSMDLRVSTTPVFHPSLIRPSPGNSVEDITGTLRTIHSVCDEIIAHFEETPGL